MPKFKSCKSKHFQIHSLKKRNGITSFVTTLFIVLLPKCPFCIAAYSGALLLFLDIEVTELSAFYPHVKPVLGFLVLSLILWNYRGQKTIYASITVGLALSLLILKTYFIPELLEDGFIYTLFIFAIWVNGNFESFLQLFKKEKK